MDAREREIQTSRLQRELETEYQRAEERRSRRHQRKEEHQAAKESQRRAAEEAALQAEVTEAFWTAKGYVKYVDSRGRERWLPKEEAERRVRRREADGDQRTNLRPVLVYGAMVLVAVATGVAVGSC